ncbi:uncharacterized protein [Nicotiana sylvestris]|uniref:uncharacterized protein n=1 Tax=Nicotiana sylvestris TaxID=4096 RepID=UPI00388CCCAC
MKFKKLEEVKLHLYRKGFIKNYFVWTNHGEIDGSHGIFHNMIVGESSRSVENTNLDSRIQDMVVDAFGMHYGGEPNENVEQTPSELSVTVRLLSIKSDWNISQAAMESFIDLMSELVDPTINLPGDFYKENRLVSKLGLSSMRIGCCEEGCMLYYKDDATLDSCKFCEKPRFKRLSSENMVDVKVMQYLPLIPRLKRLYASMSFAPHMRWHFENRRPPGVMCHPSDGEAWKHFDRTYPDFASEPRNIRMLSRWMTAGKLACPYCMENGKAFTLKHGRKQSWFDCHRQFLPHDHNFKGMKNAFKMNKMEYDSPPPILSGEEIWERVQNFSKVTKVAPYRFPGYGVTHNWTKQSILWELPYWTDNLLNHKLDVIHIEKNYFDNLFNTVMDGKGK